MLKDKSLPLRQGATNLVFGVGNPDTKILFIGEGPGYWEDQKGEPFVGNAGKLLNSLLQLIKLERSKVYITNVIHHRPPNNRDPEPSEIAAYALYLDKIIEIIKPRVVVTLGRFSMGKFLPGVKITAIHGREFSINWKGKETTIVPMFHPAAALRSTEVLRAIKEDFIKLPEILNRVKEEPKGEQMKFI
ncbi:hypothetical protein A2V56_05240 [Candidatus Woesebacteria bacterium RBG_19FT_COMBO_42_9]|uniref:Type-4 uracil-DNA glycosylase n=1 Tax=Candidatus Woesebacteria bacterium RBG_16_42_24 TaxID=1802485 RepID=A0A1F7XM37_9BACT|nr:MAG: hypothetical protein A2V97_03900 [Candidatus Woesebacteria bacterium RBG_16_42_24]OGM17340.1 MAG: hypothetical protein A2V56_05240 [Candidatus Woesebacteria bacterium RBG_19FT_COMBO_42_9]OGM68026.1 MAG: hypothetical protein A2985_00895 [Candidatus Woesebacteria bacterium RIFCSPLOWO2_01_FULL_43_11]